MTAYELYSAVLYELNQYQAPAFEPGDFNYFFNDARQAFVDEEKAAYEVTQQLTDNLRAVLKKATQTLTDTGSKPVRFLDLPKEFKKDDKWEQGAYQHLFAVRSTFEFLKDLGKKKKGDVVLDDSRRYTDNMGVLTDYYQRPKVNDLDQRTYYQVRGNRLEILYGLPHQEQETVRLKEVELMYLAFWEPIKLASKNKTDSGHVNSDWPKDVDRQIVKRCALTFLENNASGRTATYAQTQNP